MFKRNIYQLKTLQYHWGALDWCMFWRSIHCIPSYGVWPAVHGCQQRKRCNNTTLQLCSSADVQSVRNIAICANVQICYCETVRLCNCKNCRNVKIWKCAAVQLCRDVSSVQSLLSSFFLSLLLRLSPKPHRALTPSLVKPQRWKTNHKCSYLSFM